MDTWTDEKTSTKKKKGKKSVFKRWNRTKNESHSKPKRIFWEQS